MIKRFWVVIFFIVIAFRITILSASTLTPTQNLSFGTLIPTAASGSVVVSLSGTINTGGSAIVAPSGTGYYNGELHFVGTGLAIALDILTFTFLDTSIILTNSTPGGGSVTVSNFTNTPSLSVNILSTNKDIEIGGTMSFTSTSKGGNYTGTVRVRTVGLLSGTANATLPVILTLWERLSITQITQLNFGVIEVLTGGSVVRVASQTSARSIVSGAGGVNLVAGAPSPSAGQFTISGQPNVPVSITLPSSATLSGSGGGSMTINNFVGYPSSTSVNLGTTGSINFSVGADLNVGAAQAAGTYNGNYNVIVNY